MNRKAAQKALTVLRKRKHSDLEDMPKIKNPKQKEERSIIKIDPVEILPSRPGKCMLRTLGRQWFCDLELGHPGIRHVNHELGISWNL